MTKLRELFMKIVTSNAFATLFATTFGVLFAYYLNGLNEKSNLEKRKKKALAHVIRELESNRDAFQSAEGNESTMDVFEQIMKYDPRLIGEIKASTSQMIFIQDKIHEIGIADSIKLDGTTNLYYVNYYLYVSANFSSSAAWKAMQLDDLVNEIDYKRLTSIIEAYEMQDLCMKHESSFLDLLISEDYNHLFRALYLQREINQQMLEQYDKTLQVLKK